MIGRLRGIILEKKPPQVLLETHGIGYEVFMPMTCFYVLPETGQEAVIFTHCLVREDAQLLFGFIHKEERVLFLELIKVNGVGPKLALTILSGMSAQQFFSDVKRQEINTLMKLPGVGKKTAERLMVEMKNRLRGLSSVSQDAEEILSSAPAMSDDPESEAVAALVALGYKPQEASRMISKVTNASADCKILIRDALRAAP